MISSSSATMVAALGLALALTVAPAARAEAKTFSGMVPDLPTGAAATVVGLHPAAPRLARAADLPYEGGTVLHSNRTQLIFWQPAGSGLAFGPGYERLVETFLAQVAADSHRPTNVYGLTGRYPDSDGPAAYHSTYAGAVIDTDRLRRNGCAEPPATGPGWPVCLTDSQLEDEVSHVVAAHRLPGGPTDIYFLLTPDGCGSCLDDQSTECALGGRASGYCGYHSTSPDGLLYAVIPYNAVPGHCQSDNPRPNSSTADPAISSISHEHNETITDPDGDAWIDSSENEDGDLCISHYGPRLGGIGQSAWDEVIHGGRYYIQEEWSNQSGSCQPRARADAISFTAADHGSPGKPLSFSARARDPPGAIVRYEWVFGDGSTARGRSLSHTFKRAGAYRVVVRTTDSWDNYAFFARMVRVGKGRRGRSRRPLSGG